jgi:hypothetical protein
MGSLEIRPVHSTGDLRRFIRLPFRLYRDEPNWVAPLLFERSSSSTGARTRSSSTAEREYFLALRDGAVVGAITAQVDDNSSASGQPLGLVRLLRVRGRPARPRAALLDRAEQWLPRPGLRPHGRAGRLHDQRRVRRAARGPRADAADPLAWTHRYTPELLTGAGMAKAMDLLMWELHISGRDKVNPIIWKLADQVEERHGVSCGRSASAT